MKTSFVAGSLLAALSLVAPVHAQRVAAGVVVRSGPVAGHVGIADGYSTYRRPVVVYRRPPTRVIVIEQVHVRRHRHERDWRRQGFRPVRLYVLDGRYYDRRPPGRVAMREEIVYEREGRYYRECEDDRPDDDRRHWERD